jgi:hypothetical protein
LTPLPDYTLDRADLDQAAMTLGGRPLAPARYACMAGLAGAPPADVWQSPRPVRRTVRLGERSVLTRIDAWIPFDTIRRAGFGHVIVDGRHALILERGANLVVLDPDGGVRARAYAAGVYGVAPRYLVRIQPDIID